MPKLSVVIPVLNDNNTLPKALDSLIHQTSEDFEVIIIDSGSADGSLDTVKEACSKYVGFSLLEGNFTNRFEALNRGLKACEGDYILFLSARDFITDETIEELIKLIDESEKKPDVIVFRNYVFGNNILPHFNKYDDQLAPLPSVPKYDNLCLRSHTLGNKCYRKSFLENNKISFGTKNIYEDYLFIYKAFIQSKNTVGCPNGFLEKRVNNPSEGFEERNKPSLKNFQELNALFSEIYTLAVSMISKDTEGKIDGDESYLQEINYRYVCMILERFYSYLWYMDDETYSLFADEYNKRLNYMNDEKRNKLKKLYSYLGAPFIFESKAKVDFLCMLALDLKTPEEYKPLIESLYHQIFPFFQIAIRKNEAERGLIDSKFLKMPNLKIIDDKDFFTAARNSSDAKMFIIVKDGTPMDETVLKEFSESRSPLFLRQSVLAKIRKSRSIKQSLKEKGLNI